jgi:hypothetical protein
MAVQSVDDGGIDVFFLGGGRSDHLIFGAQQPQNR